MGRLLLLAALVAAALVATGVVEAKFVLAPLLGLAIWTWARATLRSFTRGAHGVGEIVTSDDPQPVLDRPERTLYWCEECGTELVLVVRGSGTPPRHCGTRMHERHELVG